MTLTLRISTYRGAPPAGNPSVTFDERGGTIGRAQDNDWVLPDPNRFISSRHAAITSRDGRYYITDLSLNGVLVNGQKLGQGTSTVLNDGDTLGFGDYEVRVTVTALRMRAPGPTGEEAPAYLPEGTLGIGPVLPEPKAAPGESSRPEPFPGIPAGEPFTVPLPGVPGEPAPEPTGPPMRDDLARIHEPFAPPRPISELPERWWEEPSQRPPVAPEQPAPQAKPLAPALEGFPEPPVAVSGPLVAPPPAEPLPPVIEGFPAPPAAVSGPPAVPPAEPPPGPFEVTKAVARPEAARPPAGPPPPPPAAAPPLPPAPPAGAASAEALLRGLGLDPGVVAGLAEDEVLELAGRLLRVMVGGLRELLAARASIKQEARLEMTTLRPRENNPLKFTVTTDDALRHLLRREPPPGYLGPIAAVEEVMQDLKAHQLATLAGLEATLKGMFQRFDPGRLEHEFTDRSLLDTLLPGHRKGRCWDLFGAEFRRIAQEAEEDFRALFGREFARAYEEQVRRLRAGREGAGALGHPTQRGTPS
jgi:type VI secretion system protein